MIASPPPETPSLMIRKHLFAPLAFTGLFGFFCLLALCRTEDPAAYETLRDYEVDGYWDESHVFHEGFRGCHIGWLLVFDHKTKVLSCRSTNFARAEHPVMTLKKNGPDFLGMINGEAYPLGS